MTTNKAAHRCQLSGHLRYLNLSCRLWEFSIFPVGLCKANICILVYLTLLSARGDSVLFFFSFSFFRWNFCAAFSAHLSAIRAELSHLLGTDKIKIPPSAGLEAL